MAYYDQHLHTYFSPDSSETFERYLARTEGIIVTTEHLDFGREDGSDVILDYDAYTSKISELNKQYNDRIRRGIEIGYTKESHDKIINYLDGKTFDVKLLSIHQNGKFNFMTPIVDTMDPKEVMKEYFELCIEAVKNMDDIHVLAHFDFGLRRLAVSVSDLKEFEYLLKQFLETMVERDIALELNMRSMYDFGNLKLYSYMIDLYLDLGGTRFSLGSDAHSVDKFRYHFDDATQLLKEKGIYEVIQFQQGMGYFEKI